MTFVMLGIETSCDETAAAVVDGDGVIRSNVVLSQFRDHARHGGVVPEIAARAHLDGLNDVIDEALREAGVTFAGLDGVAATAGPGLIGGVMVGLSAGKALAAYLDKPFYAVNHMEGHALSPRLGGQAAFPYLLLLVSGGHSQILLVRGYGDYHLMGTTIDDAAGECFDKSAKLLGLAQPGGPNLEKLAGKCADVDAAITRFDLPHPLKGRQGFDFSFSGLKTAVRERIADLMDADGNIHEADASQLAAALQDKIGAVLARQCARALESLPQKPCALVVAGGVAANGAVRAHLVRVANAANLPFVAPPLSLCTDNAAMIAAAGYMKYQKTGPSPLNINAVPYLKLT